MDNVVPFAPRPNAGGGWTAAERERLSELAERLSASGVKVEVVYGMTDEGDPWCVIKDDQEEVLIHVARINGSFVIHDASVDTIQQGETLWSATDRLLGGDWRDSREDVVVSLSARQAQTFVALVVAATFIQHADEAEAATLTSDVEHQPQAEAAMLTSAAAAQSSAEEPQRQDLLAPQQHLSSEADSAATAAPAPTEETADAPAPPALSEPETVQAAVIDDDLTTPDSEIQDVALATAPEPQGSNLKGTDGDDLLVGGAGGDTIQGGAGDDTLHGLAGDDSLAGGSGADQLYGGDGNDTLDGGTAPEGRFDFLDGGAGDDQLHLNGATLAKGGQGADTFIFSGHPAPDGLMGMVLDYSTRDGDRLMLAGKDAKVVSQQDQANIFEGRPEFSAQFNIAKTQPGVRVGVDLDGDGREDGYFLVGRPMGEAHQELKVAVIDSGWTDQADPHALLQAFHHLAADNGDFLA
jgi:RTX calcium-binding nonapeptide repeat (4 copies)